MLNENLVQVQWSGELGAMMESMGAEAETGTTIVESRYGQLSFAPEQVVGMARGILGFPHLTSYGLAKLANDSGAGNFILLQSLEQAEVAFPTVALDLKNTLISEEDINNVYAELEIQPADGVVLCILTAREENGQTLITANLRAPVFIDTNRKMGWQVVLSNQSYPIRHQL